MTSPELEAKLRFEASLEAIYTFALDRQGRVALSTASGLPQLNSETFRRSFYVEDAYGSAQLRQSLRSNNWCVMTGKPGSGKTSLLRATLEDRTDLGGHVIHIDMMHEVEDTDFPRESEQFLDNTDTYHDASLPSPSSRESRDPKALLDNAIEREVRRAIHETYNPSLPPGMLREAAFHLLHYHSTRTRGHHAILELGHRSSRSYQSLVNLYSLSNRSHSQTFIAWLREIVAQDTESAAHARFATLLDELGLRDLLTCLAIASIPNIGEEIPAPITKTIIVVDNCDAVVEPEFAVKLFSWVRSHVESWKGVVQFVLVMRTESLQYIKYSPKPYLDHNAIWFDPIDLDVIHARVDAETGQDGLQDSIEPDSHNVQVNKGYRYELTEKILEKRQHFAASCLSSTLHSKTNFASRLLFLSSIINNKIISESCAAFGNCNNRFAMLALLQFSSIAEQVLPLDSWMSGRTDASDAAMALHAESLYYSWMAESLERFRCGYGLDRYFASRGAPAARSGELGNEHCKKLDHLILSAVYNASFSAGALNQPAATKTIVNQLAEIGIDESLVAEEILRLMADRQFVHDPNGRRVKQSINEAHIDHVDGIPIDAFLRRQYVVPADDKEFSILVGGHSLPRLIRLSDRARQVLIHTGIKFHFVLGQLKHSPYNQKYLQKINSLRVSPIDDAYLTKAMDLFREIAVFHTRALACIGSHLLPKYGSQWIDVARQRHGLPAVGFSSHYGPGNAFVLERVIYSTKRYLKQISREFEVLQPDGTHLISGSKRSIASWITSFDNLLVAWHSVIEHQVSKQPNGTLNLDEISHVK